MPDETDADRWTIRSPKLADEFSITGQWWIPGEEDRTHTGILTSSASDGITLEVHGLFVELPITDQTTHRPDVVLGVLSNSKRVTLTDAHYVSAPFSATDGGPLHLRSKYSVGHVFWGMHRQRLTDLRFRRIRVCYTSLPEWLLVGLPFTTSVVERVPGRLKLSAEYEQPPQFDFCLHARKCRVRSVVDVLGGAPFGSRTGVKWSPVARVEFRPSVSETRHVSFLHRDAIEFQQLLSLLVGEAVYPTEIQCVGVRDGSEAIVGSILSAQRRKGRVRELDHREMVAPFATLLLSFPRIVRKWFRLRSQLGSVFDLLIGVRYRRTSYASLDFLTLVQALESFHRVSVGGALASKATARRVRSLLMDAIPESINSDFRESIRAKLGYSHEYSLARRVDDLLAAIPSQLREWITPDPSVWLRRIVDTRNSLSHGGSSGRRVMSEVEMAYANTEIAAILTTLLCQMLGVRIDSEFLRRIRTRYWLFGDEPE